MEEKKIYPKAMREYLKRYTSQPGIQLIPGEKYETITPMKGCTEHLIEHFDYHNIFIFVETYEDKNFPGKIPFQASINTIHSTGNGWMLVGSNYHSRFEATRDAIIQAFLIREKQLEENGNTH